MINKPSIVWFRQDLRIDDHPALMAAVSNGGLIIPLFIRSPDAGEPWSLGAASRWWLHHSLKSLQQDLAYLNLALIIRQGAPLQVLLELINQTGADAVYWHRCYEPHLIQQDAFVKAELQKQGVKSHSFNGSLLFEPWEAANKQGRPFQVFTPFWNHCLKLSERDSPLSVPLSVKAYPKKIDTESIDSLRLLPTIKWDGGLVENWKPGSAGAKALLQRGLKEVLSRYLSIRDRPDLYGTTHLSPHLHFGEISPRMIWHAVKNEPGLDPKGAEGYLRQLGWREFAYHLLYHFPKTPHEPLKKSFESFPWNNHNLELQAWQKGQTGYPIIDAGMRQLWKTGWMHNRVRLITASFLVKDLLIDWREGAKWFWDTLVDGDLANNTLGWQWVAGCGADAAPYFRIFNPVSQAEKFDPEGAYVKKWIPELQFLPLKWLHKPWTAPEDVLRQAGVQLGVNYPRPIIEHAKAREKALEAYAKLKAPFF